MLRVEFVVIVIDDFLECQVTRLVPLPQSLIPNVRGGVEIAEDTA
jgi:hypothetical protein